MAKASKPAPKSPIASTDLGVIRRDEVYRLEVAKKHLGFGEAAMRTARRAGLRIKYLGGRGFVTGEAIIDHILEHGKDSQ